MPLMIIHENVNELDCLCMSMQKVVHFLLDSFVTTRSYNHIANYLITHLSKISECACKRPLFD